MNIQNYSDKPFIDEHVDGYIRLVCPNDQMTMHISDSKHIKETVTTTIIQKVPVEEISVNKRKKKKPVKTVKIKTETKENTTVTRHIEFPIYKCSRCKKVYTASSRFLDGEAIKVDGKIFTNLLPRKNSLTYKKIHNVKIRKLDKGCFFIHDVETPATCWNKMCNMDVLTDVEVSFKDLQGKNCTEIVKHCNKCNAYFIQYAAVKELTFPFEIINNSDIPLLEERIVEHAKQKELLEAAKAKKEQEKAAAIKKNKALMAKKQHQAYEEKRNARLESLKKERLRAEKLELKKDLTTAKVSYLPNNKASFSPKETLDVAYKDFVVRGSVFKCRHNQHEVVDINAVIRLVNRKGEEITRKVPAGYCAKCRTFFILESTYQSLKIFGTPLCRISDEKAYYDTTNNNSMLLANESILRQYGYNVNKEENLTEAVRHGILANLIDRKILTKTEIISYLDFFISQRQYMDKFSSAIAKWEIDRDFVTDYKKGYFQEFGVSGLYR